MSIGLSQSIETKFWIYYKNILHYETFSFKHKYYYVNDLLLRFFRGEERSKKKRQSVEYFFIITII